MGNRNKDKKRHVLKRDGKFITPPISCGLLNGVFRQYLLENGEIEEGVILKEELEEAEEISAETASMRHNSQLTIVAPNLTLNFSSE